MPWMDRRTWRNRHSDEGGICFSLPTSRFLAALGMTYLLRWSFPQQLRWECTSEERVRAASAGAPLGDEWREAPSTSRCEWREAPSTSRCEWREAPSTSR